MKFIKIILMTCTLNFLKTTDCKMYRVHLDDRILSHNDKTVPHYTNYFSHDNFIFEEIDDDIVQIGGYTECVKTMIRSLPVKLHIRTQYYDKAKWNEGAYQLTLPNACAEFVNPKRLWYNITKLWDSNVCPSRVGDHWDVEANQIHIVVNLPPAIPLVPWKVFVVVSQGLPGFEMVKYGFGIRMEFLHL